MLKFGAIEDNILLHAYRSLKKLTNKFIFVAELDFRNKRLSFEKKT